MDIGERNVMVYRLKKKNLKFLGYLQLVLRWRKIADRMCRSLDAIKTYKRHFFEKLGVANITEAISRAALNKLFVKR